MEFPLTSLPNELDGKGICLQNYGLISAFEEGPKHGRMFIVVQNLSTAIDPSNEIQHRKITMVLVIVFSSLEVKDRLKACLVCKKWYKLINCKILLSDINVCVLRNEGVLDFLYTTRNFVHFSFSDIFVDKYFVKLLKHIAPFAKTVCFQRCDLERKEPVVDIPSFDCLTDLIVIDCDLWCLFPALPNLKKLYLSRKSTITDDGIAILQKTMKHLKVLRIAGDIAFDSRIYKRFYPKGMTYEENPSSLVLSFLALKSFISERTRTLTELYFEYNQITPSALVELASIKNLKLTKTSLYAVGCPNNLSIFFKYQINLVSLDIDYSNLTNAAINVLCTHLPNIKELKILDSRITDHALKEFFNLKLLKKLELHHCLGTTTDGFFEAISNFKAIELKILNLYNIPISQASAPLINQWTNIVHLNLSFCHLADEHVHNISTFLLNLNYLNLAVNLISDNGITGVLSTKESQHGDVSDEVINAPPLNNLKFLTQLCLDYCCNLTDAGLIAAIKFPILKLLSLKEVNVSHLAVSIISSNNPNLRDIQLRTYDRGSY